MVQQFDDADSDDVDTGAMWLMLKPSTLPTMVVQGVETDFASHPWPKLLRTPGVEVSDVFKVHLLSAPGLEGLKEPIARMTYCRLPLSYLLGRGKASGIAAQNPSSAFL